MRRKRARGLHLQTPREFSLARRRANLRARGRFQGLNECRTARARGRLATPEQQLAIVSERLPDRAQISSVSSEAFQGERASAEAHLANPSMGDRAPWAT
jgi:hypothetical protein